MKSEIDGILTLNTFLLQREGKAMAALNQKLARERAQLEAYLDQLKPLGEGTDDLATSLQKQKSLPAMIESKAEIIAALEVERARIMARLSTLVARGEVLKRP